LLAVALAGAWFLPSLENEKGERKNIEQRRKRGKLPIFLFETSEEEKQSTPNRQVPQTTYKAG